MANKFSKHDRDDERQRHRGEENRNPRFYVNKQNDVNERDERPRYIQQSDRDPGEERGRWGEDQRFRTYTQQDPNENRGDWSERERTRSEYGKYGENAPRVWSDPHNRLESERHEREQRHWSESRDRNPDEGHWREREHNRGEETRWIARTPGEGRDWGEGQSNWRELDRGSERERNREGRNIDWQNRDWQGRERESYNRDWNQDWRSREWDRERNEGRDRSGYDIRERITKSSDQDRDVRNEQRSNETLTERVGRFMGIGPKGYRRSDERIREDVSERLEDHPDINAADIEVAVENGEVTLSGNVDNRLSKRLAEDEAARCRGVKDVHNNIRVATERGRNAA